MSYGFDGAVCHVTTVGVSDVGHVNTAEARLDRGFYSERLCSRVSFGRRKNYGVDGRILRERARSCRVLRKNQTLHDLRGGTDFEFPHSRPHPDLCNFRFSPIAREIAASFWQLNDRSTHIGYSAKQRGCEVGASEQGKFEK